MQEVTRFVRPFPDIIKSERDCWERGPALMESSAVCLRNGQVASDSVS